MVDNRDGSAVYFRLRTGGDLFDTKDSPLLRTKIKESAVLFDRVLFEPGVYSAQIATGEKGGVFQSTESYADTPKERLNPKLREVGENERFVMTLASGARAGTPVIDAPLVKRYVSEFHTIFKEIPPKADWARTVSFPPESHKQLKAIVANRKKEILADRGILKGEDRFYRGWVVDAFETDVVYASAIGAALPTTSFFEPFLQGERIRPYVAGDMSLSIVAPNLSGLDWEAIQSFREHPGAKEARRRLREFEQAARESAPGDATELIRKTGSELSDALFDALSDLRPSIPKEAMKEAAKSAVSIVPIAGPIIASGASIGEAALSQRRTTWVAALMKLREGRTRK